MAARARKGAATRPAGAQHPRTPLAHPGTAGRTAQVAGEGRARAAGAGGAVSARLTPQGMFLEHLGIAQRARALAAGLEGARLDAHIAAHRRLTQPGEMGTLFKVLGLVPEGVTMLPGLLP